MFGGVFFNFNSWSETTVVIGHTWRTYCQARSTSPLELKRLMIIVWSSGNWRDARKWYMRFASLRWVTWFKGTVPTWPPKRPTSVPPVDKRRGPARWPGPVWDLQPWASPVGWLLMWSPRRHPPTTRQEKRGKSLNTYRWTLEWYRLKMVINVTIHITIFLLTNSSTIFLTIYLDIDTAKTL